MKFAIALLLCIGGVSLLSHARPNPDQIGVCYLFQGDSLKKKDVCVISSGSGAGGYYINLYLNGKPYLFEFSHDDMNLSKDSYSRDPYFYQKLKDETQDYVDSEESIYCFKHKPYDICYKMP